MAMTKCQECGNQISTKAKVCPQCGGPVKKKTSNLLIVLLIVLLSPFICCFSSSILSLFSDSSSSTTVNRNKTTQVKSEIIDMRSTYPLGSTIENKYIRTGPSTDSPIDATGDLSPHEKIYVLEEQGDWIRFRVTPQDEGWSAWIPKKLTISEKEVIAQREAKFGKYPENSSWDGSVRCVEEYLKNMANDPDSLKFEEWSKVYYNENDGWVVYCVYRGKNAFGVYIKAANWFVIQHSQVVDMKEADAYAF